MADKVVLVSDDSDFFEYLKSEEGKEIIEAVGLITVD